MTPSADCIICGKHARLAEHVGGAIREEGGLVLAHFPIIDGAPATRGHLLVEPRRHLTELADLAPAEASALGGLLALGSRLQRELLGAEHTYVFRINDQVPHLHFHLVPRYPGTPREHWGQKLMEWKGSPKLLLPGIHQLSGELAQAAAATGAAEG